MSFIMDLLVCLSILTAIFFLIISICVKRSYRIKIIPRVLVIMTNIRMIFGIFSIILVVTYYREKPELTGKIINTASTYVIDASGGCLRAMLAGTVISVILFMAQHKTANSIFVAALRSLLDHLPEKKMKIDHDLAFDIIDEQESTRQNRELRDVTDFNGSFDGVSKFVYLESLILFLLGIYFTDTHTT